MDNLYQLVEQRVKEAERERKEAKERFKLLTGEIRGLKGMLARRNDMSKHLPKATTTLGESEGQKKRASGASAKHAEASSTSAPTS